MAATYPCGQPGSSSFGSHWRFLPRRLDGTTAGCQFILPPPACATWSMKVFAHTQVRVGDMPWGPHPPGHLFFCSSSCCQACFPTIVRPTRSLWKLTLKIILNYPELNCSVVLFERVEEDGLLSSKSRTQREQNFLVHYQSTFFHSSE